MELDLTPKSLTSKTNVFPTYKQGEEARDWREERGVEPGTTRRHQPREDSESGLQSGIQQGEKLAWGRHRPGHRQERSEKALNALVLLILACP